MTTIHHGDCIQVMNAMPPESVDAIVTDPPYGLGFMGRKWDSLPPSLEWAEACYRVLKPGGHIAAFGGTRTWHRLAVAIEDAGFEMRDSLAWLYGSGFPKSLNVAKAIDAQRLTGGSAPRNLRRRDMGDAYSPSPLAGTPGYGDGSIPAAAGGGNGRIRGDAPPVSHPDAARWQGWGTALKPAFEPIVLARKPLPGTVARNVLEHGTGAINVDACRIATDDNLNGGGYSDTTNTGTFLLGGAGSVDELRALAAVGAKTPDGRNTAAAALARAETAKERVGEYVQPSGRWPANVVLDQHTAAWVDEQSGITKSSIRPATGGPIFRPSQSFGGGGALVDVGDRGHADQGGASRFFYTAKASKKERPNVDGVQHPTVKPLAVMQWLLRLVTPPGGTVLDPFAGSGTTIEAALIEGFNPVGIEMEADYLPLIQHRIDRQAATLTA